MRYLAWSADDPGIQDRGALDDRSAARVSEQRVVRKVTPDRDQQPAHVDVGARIDDDLLNP